MTKRTKTNWWLLLLTGIIFMILAGKIITHPAESIVGLAFFIGWASLIAGIFQLGFSFSAKGIVNNWLWRLFSGIINIIIGVIFLSHPALTAKMLPVIFGFWMIFAGVSTFFNGIREQNSNLPGGWFDMLLGVLISLGGIWISYNPAVEAAILTWVMTMIFIFYGIYFIVISLQFSRTK
jgi:uncharacterized membrane protein HdeD (DUF308 family)